MITVDRSEVASVASGRDSGLSMPASLGTPDEGAAWAEIVAARWGLHFPSARWATLLDRLDARVRALGLRDRAAYRDYLDRHYGEWQHLADALIVAESRFYREADTARALAEQILPELLGHREVGGSGRRELALWSAGCSTGEEAYTLAMIALEAVPLVLNWEVHILGSDLSASNIASAREGIYDVRRLTNLPIGWQERYTAPLPPAVDGAARVRVLPALRLLTTFRQHNLCGEFWPIGAQDVIICQNVLFYFRREEQLRVLNRLYDTLRPGGTLIVGATELPTSPLRQGIAPRRLGDTFVYERPWGYSR
jgi:chemotaxis methyl-accepting protein methylase